MHSGKITVSLSLVVPVSLSVSIFVAVAAVIAVPGKRGGKGVAYLVLRTYSTIVMVYCKLKKNLRLFINTF